MSSRSQTPTQEFQQINRNSSEVDDKDKKYNNVDGDHYLWEKLKEVEVKNICNCTHHGAHHFRHNLSPSSTH